MEDPVLCGPLQCLRPGVALQPAFANINTDDPDIDRFAARGGKMLVYHGLADTLIPPQGTVNYYTRLASRAGGDAVARNFYRLFLIPAMGHGFSNGTTNPAANPPLPTNAQLYLALTLWVEAAILPSASTSRPQPAAARRPVHGRSACIRPGPR